jgi:ankyrin repeat protein
MTSSFSKVNKLLLPSHLQNLKAKLMRNIILFLKLLPSHLQKLIRKAAQQGDVDVLKQLLENQLSEWQENCVDLQSMAGTTALHEACFAGKVEAVGEKASGRIVFHVVCFAGKVEAVGENENLAGATALHWVCFAGKVEAVGEDFMAGTTWQVKFYEVWFVGRVEEKIKAVGEDFLTSLRNRDMV